MPFSIHAGELRYRAPNNDQSLDKTIAQQMQSARDDQYQGVARPLSSGSEGSAQKPREAQGASSALVAPSSSHQSPARVAAPTVPSARLGSKMPVIRTGAYDHVHAGTLTGIELGDLGHTDAAIEQFCRVLGRKLDFTHAPAEELARQAQDALLSHADPAQAGEALLEAANVFHQSDPARVMPLYEMLHAHADKLDRLSRSAPSYNLACCFLNLDEPKARAERIASAKQSLLKSVLISIDVGEKEDLAATIAALKDHKSDTVVLQKFDPEWTGKLISALQQALDAPADRDRIGAELSTLP